MNFICLVFEQGGGMLTMVSIEKTSGIYTSNVRVSPIEESK